MWRRTFGFVVSGLLAYGGWLAYRAAAAGDETARPISPVSVAEICEHVLGERAVVFVDVREPEEFAEEHIPCAVSMPIRDMQTRAPAELAEAELVVPYCLKDFRGFEGARRLRDLGLAGVRVMQDVGLSGWKEAGLPTAGAVNELGEADAWQALLERCRERGA